MKRAAWFAAGAAAGLSSSVWAQRKVRRTVERLAPANVARNAAGAVKAKGLDVVDAVREGRAAMRDKEEELRARLEGRPVSVPGRVRLDEPAVDPAKGPGAGAQVLPLRRSAR